jgi:hypothetical protein
VEEKGFDAFNLNELFLRQKMERFKELLETSMKKVDSLSHDKLFPFPEVNPVKV